MREEKLAQVRERTTVGDHVLYLGFTTTIGDHSISEEVAGFILYGFPEENICVYCLLCLIVVLVVLLVKDPKLMLA